MHGRVKVKTTAVQQEQKIKEKKKKLKLFQGALAIAFTKIISEEYDEDGMNITKQILAANSDYTTMWNYRKKAFNYYKDHRTESELVDQWKNELLFVESCLRNNPKSYGCWNQRCFVMVEMKDPDWENELHLTDLFLQLDDRNFHCWDYRRFLVQHTTRSSLKEIDFTNTLIENNFSNYSSWHYRSKLLPTVYPSKSNINKIAENKLLEELELVQNAFFTDPNDQSAWFYHRWLLGRGVTKQDFLSFVVKKSPFSVTCTLRKPVRLNFFADAQVLVDDKLQEGSWNSLSAARYSRSWVFTIADRINNLTKVVCRVGQLQGECVLSPMRHEAVYISQVTSSLFQEGVSDGKLRHLQDELESCQELNELEPENKWVLLTMVLLMKAIDPVKYGQEMLENLTILNKVDRKRASYYGDLHSRYIIEDLIVASDFSQRRADLSRKGLTRLCHFEFLTFLTYLNLSNNELTELNKNYSALHSLEILKVDHNKIRNISGLRSLQSLKDLDLRHNEISSQRDILVLGTCVSLEFVYLVDNPLKKVHVNDESEHLTFTVDLPFEN